jgi:hypothetical protein
VEDDGLRCTSPHTNGSILTQSRAEGNPKTSIVRGFSDACVVALEFSDRTVRLQARDGVFIPQGEEHRHRLRVLSERMVVFLVEEL